jgi:RHS repeat-associated protein
MGCLKLNTDFFNFLEIIHSKKSASEEKKCINYYPFGLKHKGYNNVVSSNGNSTAQKFKFEGVELEEALGYDSYEMDFRHYDPALGRFTVIDPMAEERNWLTPYNFVQNNPILRVDPTGLLDDYFDKEGNFLGSDELKTDNVQIVSKKDWDANKTVDKNGNESIFSEKGAEISTNINETQMTNAAVENVVEHYNNQLDSESKNSDAKINAKVVVDKKGKPDKNNLMRSETGGGSEIFGIRFGEKNIIHVNTTGGTVNKNLNTASNIKNTLVHEHAHQKGIMSEKGAVKVQKAHPTYKKTTASYKKLVTNYEKVKN